MTMMNDNEDLDLDNKWYPGPTTKIDWWGGSFSDQDEECSCDEDCSDCDVELEDDFTSAI